MAKKKILLAEDDEFLSRALEDKLNKDGFQPVIALDGEKALDILKSEPIDLILLDLMMPVKNGFDVLSEINSDEKLSKIPVIVSSNLGQESDIQKAKDLGADDFLIKVNSNLKDIMGIIEKHLK
jgi:DNA-binding response OmpR family regulator